ncbi:hypothetical protein N0V93_005080 [Gnomoniopsis smithogilvyi]|uniref:Uncharacterized protein n=1 Tax=Gnomoniopsis smithogilvyi TaxID=1191159 RepID=A0A9W8YU27_9PEZI|nr:hypothetical protein N0V93_005080 [Gnomoniopsis smithogilvyi]
MAPFYDHPHEEHLRWVGSQRRALGKLGKLEIDTEGNGDVLSGKRSLRSRNGVTSIRDDHSKDHDDNDDDDGKRKNRVQEANGDDDDDGRRPGDALRPTTPPPPPTNPLAVIPAALSSLLPTTPTSPLPTLSTSSVSLSSTTTSSFSSLTTSSLTTSSAITSSTSTSSTTTSQAFSTLRPLPTPSSAPAPPALNPQVVTVSSVTVMTTTSVIPVTATSSPSSFITSLFPSSTTAQSQSATAAFDTTPPSPTIFISDTGNKDDDHRNGPPPGGLSPTAEDVLISAGSIGAFILICFVCWMGLRMYKKRERAKLGMDGDDFSSPNPFLAKLPYFGRPQRPWQDLDAAEMRGPASMYETSAKSMGPTVSIYSMNSRRDMAPPSDRQGPMTLPQLDTNVAFSPLSYGQVNPFSATVSSASPSSTIQSRNAQSPQGSMTQRNFPYAEQQYPATLPPIQTRFSPDNVVNNPFASPEDAAVVTSFSPNSATQYGGAGTMETFATSETDRSRLPGFYNQSELARTASAAYDPATRAVYRASELSSISSGFGDGDIIVPPMATLQQGQDPRPYSFAKSSASRSRANSVATRSEVGSNGQRDTIYTTTSEDMPTRYRSVNSWVNQQTGRVERQQRRDSDEEIPPVPILPPEQRLTMMMDDGEEPRRYEDTLSTQPPLPALPTQNAMTQR